LQCTDSLCCIAVPYIELNSKAYATLQGYALPNDKTKLLFVYAVNTGEETPPGIGLDMLEYSVIQLNGGSITGAKTGLDVNFASMSSAYRTPGEFA
jgi:hypothetical protein